MFASVYHVFERESETPGGDVKEKDQAKDMMRKMVNSMSAKMEIGSPMASMYVLGNPDHYASHSFVAFPWKAYVSFVRNFWTNRKEAVVSMDVDEEDDDSLPIGKQDGLFVAASGVDDYRFRPAVYNNVSLYEWVQCSDRKARSQKERDQFDYELSDSEDNLEGEMEDDDSEFVTAASDGEGSSVRPDEGYASDWETDEEDEVILGKHAAILKNRKPQRHPFLPGHPLFLSHSASCNFENIGTTIPNFIGGALPRSDKGDRSYYCLAMLTLFKPWRSPLDLKHGVDTWDQAFKSHSFSSREKELLANFNVRYECNDARDDHFAALKKKMAEAQSGFTSHFIMGDHDEFKGDLTDCEYESDEGDDFPDEDVRKGPRTLRMAAEAKQIQNIVRESGWLDEPVDRLPFYDGTRIVPAPKSRMDWIKLVKAVRSDLTANKLQNMPPRDTAETGDRKIRAGIDILPPDYFHPKTNVAEQAKADIIQEVLKNFNLNDEQRRAFMIVASHASKPQSLPLRMYMGGMGGTGKSEVLKAIVAFFKMRNEDHRYMILGPTGSSAALLGGST
ncbi:hypothetical protein C8R46DRAFT_895502, partial [Mycena filopes]